MNDNFDFNLNTLIKKLKTIYFAQISGLVLLFAVLGLLRLNEIYLTEITKEQDYILNTIALLFTIIAIPAGYYIFSLKGKQCTAAKLESIKLDLYKSAKIIKYSAFGIAGTVILIAFGITGSKQSLLFFAAVIIIFLINKPGENNFHEYFNNQL